MCVRVNADVSSWHTRNGINNKNTNLLAYTFELSSFISPKFRVQVRPAIRVSGGNAPSSHRTTYKCIEISAEIFVSIAFIDY